MTDPELAYYRAVEDQFGRLRGTPFLFNPKDFALLRRWWADGVPLAAVFAGLGEVFERSRREGHDAVSSLSYCRHAVARHAKRLAAAHAGSGTSADAPDIVKALDRLTSAVREVADLRRDDPPLHAALDSLAFAIASIPSDADPSVADEILTRLEGAALTSLLAALPPEERDAVEREADEIAGELPEDPEVRARSRRAVLLRELRARLGLPRLELTYDA